MDHERKPSLDDLFAQSARVEQGLLERRNQLSEHVITARDDWGLVEVRVNGHGDVVEVAVDADLVGQVEPIDLAEAMLEAVRAAQQQARAMRHGRPGHEQAQRKRRNP